MEWSVPRFRLVQCVQVLTQCSNDALVLVWVLAENILTNK